MQVEFEDYYDGELASEIDEAMKFCNKLQGTPEERKYALDWVKRAIYELHLRVWYDNDEEHDIDLDKYKHWAPKEEDLNLPTLENTAYMCLRKQLDGIDYDRKMLSRYARGREFTDSEKEEMDHLNACAAKVWGEITRRRGPRPEEKTE